MTHSGSSKQFQIRIFDVQVIYDFRIIGIIEQQINSKKSNLNFIHFFITSLSICAY
jgi:hypothetical protein